MEAAWIIAGDFFEAGAYAGQISVDRNVERLRLARVSGQTGGASRTARNNRAADRPPCLMSRPLLRTTSETFF